MELKEKYKMLALAKYAYENGKLKKKRYQDLKSGILTGVITTLPPKLFGNDYIRIFTENNMGVMIEECIKEHQKLQQFFKQENHS